MEENRSFDSFFGTYPHADGIPMKDGVPTVCVPNGVGQCVKPFRDPDGVDDSGGAHGAWTASFASPTVRRSASAAATGTARPAPTFVTRTS
jgi:phospholipase C